MDLMSYTPYDPTIWEDDTTPHVDADRLNKIENGIKAISVVVESGGTGGTGDGSVEYYEQPDEPLMANEGALWVDTDEEPPGTGVGADGGGPGSVYGGTRPLDGGGVV
jgi:hypothetical protein